jgi:hypothetical protein
MARFFRARVQWTGTPLVGPSLTTFLFDEASTSTNIGPAVKAFFTTTKGLFPTGITWSIPNSGDIISADTGELVGTWGSGADLTEISSGGTSWNNGVGARVVWKTNDIWHKRRVRGSTFMVPLTTASMASNGNVASATATTLNSAANALMTAAGLDLRVWSRPGKGGTPNGASHKVVDTTVPLTVSWLRSRKV